MAVIQPAGIAMVVVLYHPSTDVVFNLASYARDAGRLYAIDNTEEPQDSVTNALRAIADLEYISMSGNAGLGAALNVGIARARDAGYSWVLTMDQDSTPQSRMLCELAQCASDACAKSPLGLVSPILLVENGPPEAGFAGSRAALTTITSGSLVSVPAWNAVGGFDETLFIDQVDHEFCLRLHLGHFEVLECGRALLHHRMGEMHRRRLLGPVYVSNHSALRRYYITRNRLAVMKRYRAAFPEFRDRESRAMWHELLKVLLLEDHKWAKLLMSWRGYRDYRRGVAGPYADPEVGGSK